MSFHRITSVYKNMISCFFAALLVSACGAGTPGKGDSSTQDDAGVDLADTDFQVEIEKNKDPVGLGTLVAQDAAGEKISLNLDSVWVSANRVGDYAFNRVEHIFTNTGDSQLEGTFRFPLPDGASVAGLAMEIKGQLMDGELVERTKARKTYETIVASMRDPALLEWQQGQVFKLRVFPIEPKSTKRIVLSYIAPLRDDGKNLEYCYATNATDMQTTIPLFRLDLDGNSVVVAKEFSPGTDIVVPIGPKEEQKAAVYLESVGDSRFASVRLSPKWRGAKPAKNKGHAKVVILVDTSRSALEHRQLASNSIGAILESLRPKTDVMITACDMGCRNYKEAFVPRSKIQADEVVQFVDFTNADGASDLEASFSHVGALLKSSALNDGLAPQIVYVGDGTATWGEVRPAALKDSVKATIGSASVSAVVLGRGADMSFVRSLAGITGGRVVRPKTAYEVRKFSAHLRNNSKVPRMKNVRVFVEGATDVFPREETALFKGDSMTVTFRIPSGTAVPNYAVMRGEFDGRPVEQAIKFKSVGEGQFIAHRWAASQIEHLGQNGGSKEEIVKTSLEYGVMSKHTSFLVLESEEAYERFGIERRARKKDSGAPEVSGRNLESLDDRDPSLHPNQIQPGDPEIRIPAPKSARAVVVVFPFGETKQAVFEEDLDAWVVRFLVDKETPDGKYQVLVRITHEDGGIEILKLQYVVDTQAPKVTIEISQDAKRPKFYRIDAKQIVTELDMQTVYKHYDDDDDSPATPALFSPDLQRVEVTFENGRILRLRRDVKTGNFYRRFKSSVEISKMETLKIVTFDRALNTGQFEVPINVVQAGRK